MGPDGVMCVSGLETKTVDGTSYTTPKLDQLKRGETCSLGNPEKFE